jgi:hypothetical protein
MSTKKLVHFGPRNTPADTGYTQWLLSIPYSVKLLPSPQWTVAFRNTRNWNSKKNLGRTFISQAFSYSLIRILLAREMYSNWTEPIRDRVLASSNSPPEERD